VSYQYIVDMPYGPRLVTSATAALDLHEQGHKVWRVSGRTKMRQTDLLEDELEESLAPRQPSSEGPKP
jgi:hypothetical protein